jgi:predicted secreted protein
MAAKLGNDRKLFIQSSVAGTYNEIKGQGSLKRGQRAGSIDISDKNTAPYGKVAPGNFDVSVTMSGIVDLPDANGIERVYDKFKTRATELYEVRKSPFAPADVVFRAEMYVLGCDLDDPKDGASSYDLSLGLAAAPSIDLLG